jgi:hypothetical protein
MECLINYIGLQACANTEPSISGKYINTLPGISLESIDKIANAEQVTYAGVWRDAQIEAAEQLLEDFKAALSKCHTLSNHCDYEAMACDNIEHLARAWKYLLGVQLMLYRIHSPRLNRFTTIDLKDAKELLGLYQAEYESALNQAIPLIDVSSCCQTECSNNPQRVIWLP